jgi:thiol:disulfide interchange protein
MLPVVRELETDYAERVGVKIVDYYNGDNKPLLEQYGVRGHPSILVLGRDGTPSPVFRGIVPKEKLVEAIEAALA